MRSVAQLRLRPSELGYHILGADPGAVEAAEAAEALKGYLGRKRPALAGTLEVRASGAEVLVRAAGRAATDALRELIDLLESYRLPEPEAEVEVDPDEFALEVADWPAPEVAEERLVLRSRARYFPYPVCEWFEISTGELRLTDRRVVYEPEWAIVGDGRKSRGEGHEIPLGEVLEVERGEWWDVPCVLIRTAGLTYRYGWPAERREPETAFDVDEWLERLRSVLAGGR